MVRTRISTSITIGPILTGLRGTQLTGSITFTLVTKSFFKEETWALSSSISSTWLVTTQVLEEVEASLLKQQGKESNSSQDVAML
jgi:hypothetical protein